MPGALFQINGTAIKSDPSEPTMREDLPAEVAGQPASYFWKEMIHTGSFAQPESSGPLVVDIARLSAWADRGRGMLGAGVAIPINCDHSLSARDVVGYVKDFKVQGNALMGLCQFIGDDARLLAARNQVSVGIDPNFIDGQGQDWGEAVVHLALTPAPVVPGQGEFVEAGEGSKPVSDPASADDAEGGEEKKTSLLSISVSGDQWEILRALLGDDVSVSDCVPRIIDRLNESEPDDVGVEESDDANLALKPHALVEMSRASPSLPAQVSAAVIALATARFDAAVERGCLSPIARDRLMAALVTSENGPANLITLSMNASSGADQSLAMTVADILLDNPPVVLGQATGLQTLSRTIPGQQENAVAQLREYMTKVASVSS